MPEQRQGHARQLASLVGADAAMAFEVPVPDTEEAAAHLKRVLGQYEEKRAKRTCGEADAAAAVVAARASAMAARAEAAGF